MNFGVPALPTGSYALTLSIGGFNSNSKTLPVDTSVACSYSLIPSVTLQAAGSSGAEIVSSATGCNWTATADPSAPWLKITAGAGGSGNGIVNYSVDANPGALSRTGVITIAGKSFTVTQTGVTCFYSYGPTSQNFTSSGGSGSLNISAPPGCHWTAASNSPFITAPSPASGSGNGQVTFTANANSGASQQTGTITITGTGFSADFTVTEATAAATYACTANAIPAIVRLEGVAELAADLVLQCSGTSTGTVMGDLHVALNTGVTSRILDSAGTSEALLLLNEPTGPTLGVNAFRGKIVGSNAVVFRNVPLRPASGAQTMRITNLRLNASQLGVNLGAAASLQPPSVTALIQMNAAVAIPVTAQQQTVAIAEPSVVVQQGAAASGPVSNTQVVSLTYGEQFANTFKQAIVSGQDPSQPGQTYNSESGFVNSAQLGASGRADTGTRLRAHITNIPGGTCVYAAVFSTAGAAAQLVSADSNGAGGTFEAGVSMFGGTYQQLTCQPASTTGSTTATWEVTSPNPASIESSSFTLLFQNAGSQISQIQIAASLAPVTQDKFAASDSTVPVPRFLDNLIAIPVVTLRATTTISTPGGLIPTLQGRARPYAMAGGNLTFSDQIINDSASTALNVTVRSNLPPTLTLQPDICSSPPAGASAVCDNNGVTVVYPSLAAHSRTNLNFSAHVGASVPGGTLIQVTTALSSDLPVFDPNSANATLTFTVESSGCSPQISPPAQIPAAGGSLSFQVTSCPPWSASVDQLWLGLTAGSYFETSSATVMVQVQSNTGPARSANLRIADQTVTITQAAGSDARDFTGNAYSGALLYDPNLGQSYTALSNGNGTFSYAPNLLTPHFDKLRTGDFNGDGKADLIVYNSQTALAYIGFGNGDGTFNFQSLFWSPGYDFVEAGDLNGDGKTDFALYNSSTGTLYTGISNGLGGFTYKYTLISKGYTYLRLADFNGDGKADLFAYNAANGNATVGIGDGLVGSLSIRFKSVRITTSSMSAI